MDTTKKQTPLLEAVERYQCNGCAKGPALHCYKKYQYGGGCADHFPGTFIGPCTGLIMAGMPNGFDRIGPLYHSANPATVTKLIIFEKWEDANDFYDQWNIPVWKHLDSFGNTLVRGMHPRNNMPFLHIYLGNHLDKINCFEVSQEMVDFMD